MAKLSTKFSGIEESKLDARIDALKKEIDKQLAPILKNLGDTLAQIDKIQIWQQDNLTKTVHANPASASRIVSQEISAMTNACDPEELDVYNAPLADLMRARPRFSLKAAFTFSLDQKKATFLEDLKKLGEKTIADAQKALDDKKIVLRNAQEDNLKLISSFQKYYQDLLQSIAANDAEATIRIMESPEYNALDEDERKDLLLLPFKPHASAFAAIAAMKFIDSNQEARVISSVLNAFADDEGLDIIQDSATRLNNDVLNAQRAERAKKYEALAATPSGRFVHVGDDLINTAGIACARVEDGKLFIHNSQWNESEYDLETEEAAAVILAVLANKPGYIRIEDEVFNIAHIGMAYFDNDQLTIGDITDNHGRVFDIDEESANKIIASLSEKAGFVLSDGVAFNLKYVANISDRDDEVHFQDTGDNGRIVYLSAEDKASLFESIAGKPEFIRVGDELLNLSLLTNFTYSEGSLRAQDIDDAGWDVGEMDEDQADTILADIASRPGFIMIEDDVFNLGNISKIYYEDGEIYLHDMGDNSGWNFTLGRNQAKAALAKLAANPDFIRIGNEFINCNHIEVAYYENGTLYAHDIAGDGSSQKMPVDQAEAILSSQATRKDCIRFEGDTLDIWYIQTVSYDGSSIVIEDSNGNSREYPKDENNVDAAFNIFRNIDLVAPAAATATAAVTMADTPPPPTLSL